MNKKFLEEVEFFDKNEAVDAWDQMVSIEDNELDPYLATLPSPTFKEWEITHKVYSSIAGCYIDSRTGLPLEDEK